MVVSLERLGHMLNTMDQCMNFVNCTTKFFLRASSCPPDPGITVALLPYSSALFFLPFPPFNIYGSCPLSAWYAALMAAPTSRLSGTSSNSTRTPKAETSSQALTSSVMAVRMVWKCSMTEPT